MYSIFNQVNSESMSSSHDDRDTNTVAKAKKARETQTQQDKSITDKEPMSDDQGKLDVRISSHDVSVQILARLDDSVYQQAVDVDAKSIRDNFTLERSFPWRIGTRLPKKALKAMPRDIDELHAVTHCDGNLYAPFGFNGPFGYGRFENGQARGKYCGRGPLTSSNTIAAAARRSADPGVIELSTQLPLPLDSSTLLTPIEWKRRLQEDEQMAKTLSLLPFNWKRKEVQDPTNANSCFNKPSTNAASDASIKIASHCDKNHEPFDALDWNESKIKPEQQRDFSLGCSRKWRVSMKVEGVSTRTSLFPPSTAVAPGSGNKGKQQVVRPMMTLALLHEEIQTGKSVSTERASELDEEGLAQRLGSYDSRFAEKLLNDSTSKKRVEVGRTRLVWSNLIHGKAPGNKVTYNSLITGRRVDPSTVLRPREIKVGVRIEGKLLQEEAMEDVLETNAGNTKKRKQSTRQATESEVMVKRQFVQMPESRTDAEIEDAFAFSLDPLPLQDRKIVTRSTVNGSMICLFAPAQMDHCSIISSLLKFNQHNKESLTSVPPVPTSPIPLVPPRFSILPGDDMHLSVCISTGKMPGSSVHQSLRDVSQAHSNMRCSVCWSDGSGVLECSSCGLLVHRNCCLDNGHFIRLSNDSHQPSRIVPDGQNETDMDVVGSQANPNSHQVWECAVCYQYTEKPRRNARLPSRFKIDMVREESKQAADNTTDDTCKNVPGPRCALCPHRGGAMSLMEPKESQQWAHEVCRIWSSTVTLENREVELMRRQSKVLSSACALCGGGGVKRGKPGAAPCLGITTCAAEGCHVAFHPMCALITSKITIEEQPTVPSGKSRLSTEQMNEEKKSEENDGDIAAADKKLCNEYTLQLVKLAEEEGDSPKVQTAPIPVAFCGLHNPRRETSFYGCLPGESVAEE